MERETVKARKKKGNQLKKQLERRKAKETKCKQDKKRKKKDNQ